MAHPFQSTTPSADVASDSSKLPAEAPDLDRYPAEVLEAVLQFLHSQKRNDRSLTPPPQSAPQA